MASLVYHASEASEPVVTYCSPGLHRVDSVVTRSGRAANPFALETAVGEHRAMELVAPGRAYLGSYLEALRREWSPTTVESDFWRIELERVEADPDLALRQLNERDGGGRTITLPDGTEVPRIPGVVRWMWDGEFAGAINARWQPGTAELPPHVLGHIGYSVVPWRQRRGYATEALRQMLELVRPEGLPYVEITTQPDNIGSQKVIEANGGVSLGEFVEPEGYGGHLGVKYRVDLG